MDFEGERKNTRCAMVLNLRNGEWEAIDCIDIKKGMIFKLFEYNGKPVSHKGVVIFIASMDSFLREDGIIQTNIK